jgi:hypothetical protein
LPNNGIIVYQKHFVVLEFLQQKIKIQLKHEETFVLRRREVDEDDGIGRLGSNNSRPGQIVVRKDADEG